MIRNLAKRNIKYSAVALFNLFGADQIDNATKTEQTSDISVLNKESGWDRVKRIFAIDEFGNISYEANSVLQVSCMSTFIGAVYGGVMNSRIAYMNFMKTNQATSFKSHLDAKKKLQDAVTISFGKGAFKFAWRLTLFSSSFVGTATLIQAYRGKTGILEYVSAGAISGFLYKFNLGPRAWIVGSGLGAALGLMCGGATLGILHLTGISMDEARYWQYYWKDSRNEYFKKGVADYLEKEDFAVIKLHNDRVGEEGKNIENIDKNISNSTK